MKIEKFQHIEVRSDGKVAGGGAVETAPFIRMGTNEGCGLPSCNCSGGYYISISTGITQGKVAGTYIVEGVKAQFDSKEEYETFLRNHELMERRTR